jgi:hypothetical protein
MTECEKALTICIDKHIASLDRESRHAVAAATLDEGVVFATDKIGRLLRRHKPHSVSHLLVVMRRLYIILSRVHDEAATVKSEPVGEEIPLVRLGPGGDYIIDIMEDDV